MNDKLYDFMDWAEIEAVVYSEEDHPKRILGPRVTEEGLSLIHISDSGIPIRF